MLWGGEVGVEGSEGVFMSVRGVGIVDCVKPMNKSVVSNSI